ncbi:hypothetical protein [Burkholderia ubonensis]|nr:hypothetical protein [Burkholderia ubonensis]
MAMHDGWRHIARRASSAIAPPADASRASFILWFLELQISPSWRRSPWRD